jgi:alcohol dehydrogenase
MPPDLNAELAAALAPFDYHPRTRVVFGVNSVERVGELAKSLTAKRVLLVTDRGIVSAGHAGRV